MSHNHWQPKQPIEAIIFDCDGTLSTIEGINEIAEQNNVGDIVQALTDKAMNETGVNPDLYQQRLKLVAPNQQQAIELGEIYYDKRVPDAKEVIALLQDIGKEVYIISAGINPSVKLFAKKLNVTEDHVYAVDVNFDADGKYTGYDTDSPLSSNLGKLKIVEELQKSYKTIAHIGDGMNDLITLDLVTRFIGYGGVFHRQTIKEQCEYYITDISIACALPLLLTADEAENLNADQTALYEKSMACRTEKEIELQKEKFIFNNLT